MIIYMAYCANARLIIASVVIMFIIRNKHFLQKVASVAITCSWTRSIRCLPSIARMRCSHQGVIGISHVIWSSFRSSSGCPTRRWPTLFALPMVITNNPFRRHGPWWIIAVLSLVGNLPSWKRARSVGLSSVRSNSWTTGPRRAGSAVQPLLVPPLLVPPLLVLPLLVPPLLVPPLLVLSLLVPPLLVPPLLVPPLLVLPLLVSPLLVLPLLVPPLIVGSAVVGSAVASFPGAGTAAASSSGAGIDGETLTASRLLFSGLPLEVSSSPVVVVTKNSGFYSCPPPLCPVDASSLVVCSTGGIQARMFINQYSLRYFHNITKSQAYAPMRWRRTNISQLPLRKNKHSTRGPLDFVYPVYPVGTPLNTSFNLRAEVVAMLRRIMPTWKNNEHTRGEVGSKLLKMREKQDWAGWDKTPQKGGQYSEKAVIEASSF